jgi:Fur family transcriptional regulator, peroxide stress response regulator
MQQQDEIIQLLKQKGLRVTSQRFAVYVNMLERCDHPTAEQVLHALNQNAPISSQATVYTSLQSLCDVGLLREVLLEEGVCRYDANVVPHHHFCCRCCGKIEDVAWDDVQGLTIDNVRAGLKIESYELTMRGICDNCQSDNANEQLKLM